MLPLISHIYLFLIFEGVKVDYFSSITQLFSDNSELKTGIPRWWNPVLNIAFVYDDELAFIYSNERLRYWAIVLVGQNFRLLSLTEPQPQLTIMVALLTIKTKVAQRLMNTKTVQKSIDFNVRFRILVNI